MARTTLAPGRELRGDRGGNWPPCLGVGKAPIHSKFPFVFVSETNSCHSLDISLRFWAAGVSTIVLTLIWVRFHVGCIAEMESKEIAECCS